MWRKLEPGENFVYGDEICYLEKEIAHTYLQEANHWQRLQSSCVGYTYLEVYALCRRRVTAGDY